MSILLLGADFVDAPLPLLGRLEEAERAVVKGLANSPDSVLGVVSLITCNRAEIYLETTDRDSSLAWAISAIADSAHLDRDEVARVFRVVTGSSVMRHLCAVASGLESMVIGESEITGQVRRALGSAQERGQITPALNRMFQTAQQVAKSVSATTGVGRSGRSIIHTALDLVGVGPEVSQDHTALIVGTGAYARVVTAALQKRGVSDVQVYSRSGRAPLFAEQHGITAVSDEDLELALARADWVVSASGQPGHAMTANHIHRALSLRTHSRPLQIIDVALSPDVDPAVASLEGCELFTLDTLRRYTPLHHREAVLHAERLVEDAAAAFTDRERARRVDPLIHALRSDIDARVEKELDRARKTLDVTQIEAVERAVRQITHAVLHTPTTKARDLAREGREGEYAQALSLLFDLEQQES